MGGNKKSKSLLRDLYYDLSNNVLQDDDLSNIIGGTTNHNNDNSGIGDDCPQ